MPSQLHYAIGHGVFDIRCTTPSVPADDMTQHPQGWSRRDGKHFRQSTVDCFRSNRMHRWRCESDHCRSQEEVYAYCRLPVCDLRSFREQGCCITKSVWRERQRQQWQRRSRRDGTTVVNNINSGNSHVGELGELGRPRLVRCPKRSRRRTCPAILPPPNPQRPLPFPDAIQCVNGPSTYGNTFSLLLPTTFVDPCLLLS